MPYIGTSPSNGVRRVHTYTATASQTTFSGAGAEGTSLSYKDSNFVDVYQNGIKLGDADYTSTSGTSIVLAQGASTDDLVVVVVFDVFSVADTVSKADGGTFDGNITMAGTLGVTGAVTANAGVNIDNITIDGTEIDLSSGNLTIDVAGQLVINSDSGQVVLQDDTVNWGNLQNSSGDFVIESLGADKDMIFKGLDGSSVITALTLDMSASGDATFNGQVIVPQYVAHAGDGNTFMEFDTDIMGFTQGGVERLEMNRTAGAVRIKPGGSNVIYFDGNGQSINNENRRARLDMSSNTAAYSHILCQNTGTGNGVFISFVNSSGTAIGSISQSGSSTSFNTSSDYRLKENVNYDFDATTELKKLKPCKFNFIGESETVEGFLAHEVSNVVPKAITGVKDGTQAIGTITDADGNVLQENVIEARVEDGQTWTKTGTENVYQSISQDKLVPLLVKTIQELEARITALENA